MSRHILTALLLLSACLLSAQNHPNRRTEGRVGTIIGSSDAVNFTDSADVYRVLLSNAPVEPEFQSVPRFAIVGAGGKFYFSIGAQVKATACYDWGNPVPNPSSLGTSSIEPAAPGNDGLFQMTAQQSSIYFNIIGFPHSAHQLGVFLSLSMNGSPANSYRLHTGHVYARYRNLLFGYNTSLYNDVAADAYLLDSHGPCASGSHSSVQINYQRFIGPHFRYGLGIEKSSTSYTPYLPSDVPAESLTEHYQRYPDVPLYVNYIWGNNDNHVRLSGVLRFLQYRDLVSATNRTNFGWGIKLTGAVRLDRLVAYFMGQTGSGIASYLQDNADFGLDMVPDGTTGRLRNTKSWGCIGALQYNYTPTVFSTVMTSYMRNYVRPYDPVTLQSGSSGIVLTDYADQMRRGLYVAANVVWHVSTLVRVGLEYVHAAKTTFAHDTYPDNRIMCMALMAF